ncbi:HAD-IIIA family hydrolase [Gemmatimonas groenlandica]|uniref:D,D-heptose 1,7-bisphosphate phosphatase n=1 Tax=Gemmatimonas groenlandica TaxID=2732249 RepID=A0A6M4INY4_9BACT|nr:HAD-IIIA family hydrolase [Gemmatimonas groenlandica]QJR35449.1 HAD-IIIA family hydrolase [Gemmatimonas groenlandica]
MTASPSEHAPVPALFIDRDGTLIADAHYLADANRVQLIPGAAAAVAKANAAQVPVVVVTNQSGIARGLITTFQYEAVRDRTNALLSADGAAVLATYHCPHWGHPKEPCECRKPGLGMYREAAAAYALDLAHSAYIGDRWRDVQPALATGGIGILVPGIETPSADVEEARSALSARIFMADNILEAVSIALAMIGARPPLQSPSDAQ